nr:right-handed parallel beta-helix repeat-containing protein [uncultured Sphingobacterium sp.]
MKLFKIVNVVLLLFIFTSISGQTRVNVRDFGAKGDGQHNDAPSILAALSKINKYGGVLYFPKGLYLTSVIDIKATTTELITFEGEDGAILKKDSRDPVKVAVIFSEKPNANLVFKNLQIDGNYLSNPRTWKRQGKNGILITNEINGIFVYNANHVTVEKCSFFRIHGNGIAAFNTKSFITRDNSVKDVSGSGIIGHKVDSMYVEGNSVTNAGILTDQFIVDGTVIKIVSNPYFTIYGDGISAYSNYTIIRNNKVFNGGRCGIVHDLAKDLGYKNSKLIVEDNIVEVNSGKIRNNNPPSGMWFEQSGTVELHRNHLTLIKSNSSLVSGIRFYEVLNGINMTNNTIIAEQYAKVCDNAIGIFESSLSFCNINNNSITGNFNYGVRVSYERSVSKINNFKIINNSFKGTHNLKIALYMTVFGGNEFPKKMIIQKNKFHHNIIEPLKMEYFGTVTAKPIVSELIILDRNVKLKNSLNGVRVINK